jgi:t-SNARE complex subunit (syntaxin)
MFSIISLVLGIIAIVKASNVTADFQAGQIDKALNDADTAKKLTIWAAVIAIVWPLIIVVIVPFIIGVSILGYLGALAGASGSF